MRMAGLKLKLPRCVFASPSVKCLGYIVSEQGVAPDPDNIACIVSIVLGSGESNKGYEFGSLYM